MSFEFLGVLWRSSRVLDRTARRAMTYGCRPPSFEAAITACIRKQKSGLRSTGKAVFDK